MRFNDAVLGAVLLAFSCVIWIWSQRFPAIPGQQYGASVFPSAVAIGLAACSSVLIFSGLRRGGAAIVLEAWAQEWRGPVRILLIAASVLFYIVAAKPLGFIPTMTIVLAVDLCLLRVNWWMAILIAVAVSVLLQWSFGDLLQVPLPWGIFSAYRF